MSNQPPQPEHKAGFVSIVGKPNVGKSTLMNQLVGERLSIITSKAQTTRHRIMGIINDENFQIVYSDTPGIIKPIYELHESMMRFVSASLEDADVVLFVTDIYEQFDEQDVLDKIRRAKAPIVLLINKIDLASEEEVKEKVAYWQEKVNPDEIMAISALHQFNTAEVLQCILRYIPVHPPYFDKESLTDRPERFFASEIIREQLFLHYKKEVPYSCEVGIEYFKEADDLIKIGAVIVVERDTQKAIIIGKGGAMLKKVGTQARLQLEAFFQKKVFLEQFVKVEPNWRKNKGKLSEFGYS
jgi:GTP-binding protein Era